MFTHEQVVCGELRHAARTRLMVWAFFTGTFLLRVALQHFDSTSFIDYIFALNTVDSQPMHSTSTFKLNAVSSELVESRSTCAAERDDVASVAHLSNRYD